MESKDATRRINQLMFLGLSKEDQKVFTRLEEIGSKPYGVPEKNNRKKAIQQKLYVYRNRILDYAWPPPPKPVLSTPERPVETPVLSTPAQTSVETQQRPEDGDRQGDDDQQGDGKEEEEDGNKEGDGNKEEEEDGDDGEDDQQGDGNKEEDGEDDQQGDDSAMVPRRRFVTDDDDEEEARVPAPVPAPAQVVNPDAPVPAPAQVAKKTLRAPTSAPASASAPASSSAPAHSAKKSEEELWKLQQTPRALARDLIGHVPVEAGHVWVDAFRGTSSFYDQYPESVTKKWAENNTERAGISEPPQDPYDIKDLDWLVTALPQTAQDTTTLKKLLRFYLKHARRGIAIVTSPLTRSVLYKHDMLVEIQQAGWAITKEVSFKCTKWTNGIYSFTILERGALNDRKVLLTTTYNDDRTRSPTKLSSLVVRGFTVAGL